MKGLTSILYVEDDHDIQAVGQMALETVGGFTVTACDSGQAAVEAVKAGAEKFQLLLLDVMMPQMDGPTALRAIRELPGGRALPVIFCTAKVQKTEIDSYRAMGAIGVVEKPFDAMELPQQVRRLWEKAGQA